MCEYYKIIPTYSSASFGIVKFSKFIKPANTPYAYLKNVLEIIWYDINNISYDNVEEYHLISRKIYGSPSYCNIQTTFVKEYLKITKREFNFICNKLKEERIIESIAWPSDLYELDPSSTNTCIKFNPKPGFEIGYHKLYHLEYFNTLGAAYPLPITVSFENKPVTIKVNKNKYKGQFKFLLNESDTKHSVYKRIWKRKKDIPLYKI